MWFMFVISTALKLLATHFITTAIIAVALNAISYWINQFIKF